MAFFVLMLLFAQCHGVTLDNWRSFNISFPSSTAQAICGYDFITHELLVLGGAGTQSKNLMSYDLSSSCNKVKTHPSLSLPISCTSQCYAQHGENLYFHSNNYIGVFNITSKTIQYPLSTPLTATETTCLTISEDGRHLFVVGGRDKTEELVTNFQIFDTLTQTVLSPNPPRVGGFRCCDRPSCMVRNNRLWWFGGYERTYGSPYLIHNHAKFINVQNISNIASQSWQTYNLTHRRENQQSVIFNDFIYIVGGKPDGTLVEQFDDDTGQSVVDTSLPVSAQYQCAVSTGDRLFVTVQSSVYWTTAIGSTASPTNDMTCDPTTHPTKAPSADPTTATNDPTNDPTEPTYKPTPAPTLPSVSPTRAPSYGPTVDPTFDPTNIPTSVPSHATSNPTTIPTIIPTNIPTFKSTIVLAFQTTEIASPMDNITASKSIVYYVVIPLVSTCIICTLVYIFVRYRRTHRKKTAMVFKEMARSARLSIEEQVNDANIANTPVMDEPELEGIKIYDKSLNTKRIEEFVEEVVFPILQNDKFEVIEIQPPGSPKASVGANQGGLEVKAWLTDTVRLGQYVNCFLENGYDSVLFVKDISNKSELQEIGITMLGHQTRIMAQINVLNATSPIAIPDQDDEEKVMEKQKEGDHESEAGPDDVETVDAVTEKGMDEDTDKGHIKDYSDPDVDDISIGEEEIVTKRE
eukprot:45646_1